VDTPRTLFRPGHNCSGVAQAARAALLVDAEAYYEAFVHAAERARRSITVVGWDFDSRTVLRFGPNGEPQIVLGDFLNRLVAKNRHLRIRILDWDYPMLFGTGREFPPIYGIAWKPHRRVDIRYDDTHPTAGSHHQKIAVFDGRIAFAGGIDLSSKRWDSCAHQPGDPRRTFGEEPYPPMHDVMALVDGEAARVLAKVVRERWKAATGETLKPAEVTEGDGWPEGVPVQLTHATTAVSATMPPSVTGMGIRHIERLYLDMIAAARGYIYIENQYFTSQVVADALRARLAEPEGPEIVLVTRLLSHGWLEEVTMQALRTKLVNELREGDAHGRFHVYYPHIDDLAPGTCIDLHSKVMIVDDEWLRVGSSNLSNRSMGMDTECDLTFEARGASAMRKATRAFRDVLLAEHTGSEPAAFSAAAAAHGTMRAAIDAMPRGPRRLEHLESPVLSETALKLAALGDLEKPLPLEAIVQEFAPDTKHMGIGPGWRAILLLCVLAVALALAWTFTPLADLVTRERVIEWGRDFSRFAWAPVVVILAYTPAAYTMFPRWLITMVAVIAFGPWKGFIFGIAGMLVAGLASFLPGRLVRRDTVRRLAGPRINRLSAALYHRGALAVAIVRMVPIAPFVVVNLVMGALRIRLLDFILGSLVGVLPGMLAATVLSEQVSRVLADPADINGWLIAVAAALMITLVYFGQRWLRRLDRESGMTS